jgi:hypothetical protein
VDQKRNNNSIISFFRAGPSRLKDLFFFQRFRFSVSRFRLPTLLCSLYYERCRCQCLPIASFPFVVPRCPFSSAACIINALAANACLLPIESCPSSPYYFSFSVCRSPLPILLCSLCCNRSRYQRLPIAYCLLIICAYPDGGPSDPGCGRAGRIRDYRYGEYYDVVITRLPLTGFSTTAGVVSCMIAASASACLLPIACSSQWHDLFNPRS